MSVNNCRILGLSNELLLYITSHCDGKSLLSLTQTCRTLKSLCDDVAVVQGAFFRRVSEGQQEIPRGTLKKWIGSDKKVLERHLVALGCADDLVSDALTGVLLGKKRNIRIDEDKTTLMACRYLPHLLVSGCHPDLRYGSTSLLRYLTLKHLMSMSTRDPGPLPDIDDWPYLEHCQWSDMSQNLHSRIAFVFAFQSLSYQSLVPKGRGRFEIQAEEHRDAFAVQVADRLADEIYELEHRDAPLLRQAILLKAVGVLALAVRTKLSRSGQTRFRLMFGETPKLPLSNGIPWINLGIEPPTPFWSNELGTDRSWASWLGRHNAAASQFDSLNLSGEWIGVYETARSSRGVDPMMVNIHFYLDRTVGHAEHEGDEPSVLDSMLIRADNCLDAVGRFNLSGQIDSSTGKFTMTKHYTAGFSWPWEGAMTPFGFVGQWGRLGSQRSGFFWLYNRSWCERDIHVPSYAGTNHEDLFPGLYNDSDDDDDDDDEQDDM